MASLSQQTGSNPTRFQENVDFPSARETVDTANLEKFQRAMSVARTPDVMAHLWGRIQNNLVLEAAALRAGAKDMSVAAKDVELFVKLRDGLLGPEHYFVELAGEPSSTQGSVQFFLQDGANKSGAAVNFRFAIAREVQLPAPLPEDLFEVGLGRTYLVKELIEDRGFTQTAAEDLIRKVVVSDWKATAG